MKIKVRDLSGYKLDYYVGKSQDIDVYVMTHHLDASTESKIVWYIADYDTLPDLYNPSNNWSIAGPIIEENDISVNKDWYDGDVWYEASIRSYKDDENLDCKVWEYKEPVVTGSNYLEAAMRCYLVSKLGEEVEDI